MNLLVVDDDPLLRVLMARYLKDLTHVKLVGMAESGAQGLQMAKKEKPDVILLDIQLPDFEPQEIIRQLRSFSSTVRIFFCSAYPDEKIASMVRRLGADGFVSKSNMKEGLSVILGSPPSSHS